MFFFPFDISSIDYYKKKFLSHWYFVSTLKLSFIYKNLHFTFSILL